MFEKAKDWISKIVKANLMFFLGMVFGSVIATITTILLTMGYLGVGETITTYHQVICGGM